VRAPCSYDPGGIATGLARRLDRDSVYTAELRDRGVTWQLTRTLPNP